MTGTSLVVAPGIAGTVTASEVGEVLVTAASTSPNCTRLPSLLVAKPVPAMVTVLPTSTFGGVIPDSTGGGWWRCDQV